MTTTVDSYHARHGFFHHLISLRILATVLTVLRIASLAQLGSAGIQPSVLRLGRGCLPHTATRHHRRQLPDWHFLIKALLILGIIINMRI